MGFGTFLATSSPSLQGQRLQVVLSSYWANTLGLPAPRSSLETSEMWFSGWPSPSMATFTPRLADSNHGALISKRTRSADEVFHQQVRAASCWAYAPEFARIAAANVAPVALAVSKFSTAGTIVANIAAAVIRVTTFSNFSCC